jgi:hypothetical protein
LPRFSKLFAKHFQIFRLESASFSKDSFGGFEHFQCFTGRKKLFSSMSKFFASAAGVTGWRGGLKITLAGFTVFRKKRAHESFG